MSLSFSHIAWDPSKEMDYVNRLREEGVEFLEVAPRRAFGDPVMVGQAEVEDKVAAYAAQGLAVRSFQALLFGANDVELFGTADQRDRLKQQLIAVGRVAGWAGAGPMVFGSPKNRLKGDLSHRQALESAAHFFREVGDACAVAGSCVVMEANPEAYGADFCTRLAEAAELVEMVDSPGFGLHVDAGGLALSGEEFEPVVRQAAALIRHVHASQPMLSDFAAVDAVHGRLAAVLKEIGYQQLVAIEMKQQPNDWEAVLQAIHQVRNVYEL